VAIIATAPVPGTIDRETTHPLAITADAVTAADVAVSA
jgi:hypothetical protein